MDILKHCQENCSLIRSKTCGKYLHSALKNIIVLWCTSTLVSINGRNDIIFTKLQNYPKGRQLLKAKVWNFIRAVRIGKFWGQSEYEYLCSSANRIGYFLNISLAMPCQIMEKCAAEHGQKRFIAWLVCSHRAIIRSWSTVQQRTVQQLAELTSLLYTLPLPQYSDVSFPASHER